ncbi:hypothetical protein MTO96_012002 [Rhipicephalus appendiculatus]
MYILTTGNWPRASYSDPECTLEQNHQLGPSEQATTLPKAGCFSRGQWLSRRGHSGPQQEQKKTTAKRHFLQGFQGVELGFWGT